YRNRKDGGDGQGSSTSRSWEDGSHIRVRNVRLSYTVPTLFADKLKLRNANIFLSGDNLLIFTKKSFYGIDPEGVLSGSFNSYGVSSGYSASRKFLLGVQLSF